MVKFLIIICALICCGGSQVRSDTENHRYKAGDPVPLYVNKVGPCQNPSESHSYFDLPFCQPDNFKKRKRTLSELLSGDNLIKAPYELEFLADKMFEVACTKTLTKEEVSQFREAINRNYYFQMYYDDLPILESIGEKYNNGGYTYILHTNIHFEILFNKDRVVEIKIRFIPGLGADITEDKEKCVDFVYCVEWKEVDTAFEKRMEKYHVEFNWFPIINTCETLVVMIGFLLKFYIRALKKGFSESMQEERGLRCIQEDVFTFPVHKSLLAAALGSGTQLFTLTILILILGVAGMFSPHNRVPLLTALIIIYTITSSVAGYTATSIYCHLEGTNWLRNLLLTGCLFTGPLLFTFCLLNSIASRPSTYKASVALPFGTIIEFVLIWTLFATPLLLLGGFIGKNSKAEVQAQCQNNKDELKAFLNGIKICRKTLKVPWYRRSLPQMALAGFLPFTAIFVELSYVFSSLWGHRIYIQYKFLFVTFILLLITIALVNVGLICCKIVSKDHKWWWRSFVCGGSIGLYVYGFCIHYYYNRSDWTGSLQLSFFFGYMGCICYGLFLMFGTVGFVSSYLFLRHIYHSLS
ncbi:transmembrane 9 superfamily member 2-like [Humulus lupulus]|uniref:transmembrane 9 superfamily member 2-like n=1 Tax=Humulus lupulus TaxID=3486 RepID=UPI002B4092BE|nr:transmembrane 9 superfamily member 2-like [Humulus lupulus]